MDDQDAKARTKSLLQEAEHFAQKKKHEARRSSVNSIGLFSREIRRLFDTGGIATRHSLSSGTHALTLAGGEMRGEYKMFKRLGCTTADAWDISEGQRDVFLKEVADGSIKVNYRIGDVNLIELEEQVYDVCYMQQSLHHIENLEHVCAEIARSLKPGGIFVLSDYIGPNRLKRSGRQRAICEPIWSYLPERLRTDRLGRIHKRLREPKDAAISPFEAVRSLDIPGVLSRHFEFLEDFRWGGVAYPLTNGFAHNYLPSDEPVLRLIWDLDRRTAEKNLCEPNFIKAVLAAKR